MSKADEIKKSWVEWAIAELNPVRFRGGLLYSAAGTKGYKVMTRRDLADAMYEKDVSLKPTLVDHVLDTLQSVAEDWSDFRRYIAFRDKVWDMDTLSWSDSLQFIYSSDIAPSKKGRKAAWDFLMQLSKGDEELARDYLQAMAPITMTVKPAGVIWFVGSGSNGKSSLINALYKILGRYFASMTTSAIEDGRDTPRLNGILGNIVRESSEGRVEDTERYKAIGTHEPFTVHKFHSQDQVEVLTDFHTIFNANNIPVFSDKTKGARRRTLIIPFPAHFNDDPTFEQRTFTPEFLGGLVELILEQAVVIRENGYRYKWSDATLRAKELYDNEVNSAEAFLSFLVQSGVAGFSNYSTLKINYEIWCAHNGLVSLGITTLKRTISTEVGAVRKTVRDGDKAVNRYFFATTGDEDKLVWLDNGYGMPEVNDIPEEIKVEQTELSSEW